MTELVEAAVLGVVQGLTEFLPVSSTGHLILTEEVLGVDQDELGLQFDAAIHLGTLAAVLVYFRGTIVSLVTAWFASLRARDWAHSLDSKLAWLILIGTVPAAIAGAAVESTAEDAFRSPALVAVMLLLFCIPMVLAEQLGKGSRALGAAGARDAVLMGAAQSIALIPGVSRSGITISTGMLAGLNREDAAVFTFLLSAPIIAAAGGKQIADALREDGAGGAGFEVYTVGLLTAGVVGYAAIAFLLRFLRTNTVYPFVVYRMLLGISVLALVAAGIL
jgi:undecaprenyl-diphosphatase